MLQVSCYTTDMCGIVGYIGKRNCSPLLLDGLSRLEYRGYDSAGLAVCDGTERLWCEKTKGRVASLRERCFAVPESTCGIAHALGNAGEPNERNAHPHGDCSGSIRVVHNGIIENYRTLKENLSHKGIHLHPIPTPRYLRTSSSSVTAVIFLPL